MAEPVVIYDRNCKPIRQSKNLRGILDYARTHIIKEITVFNTDNDYKGLMLIEFADGEYAITEFVSYRRMLDWLRSRRSWRGVQVTGSATFTI